MDEGLGMDVFNTRDQLVGKKQHRLQREFAVAEVEQILQAGAEKIDHHGIVVTFGTEPADKGNANTTGEGLVNASLILKLGVLGLDTLQLDGNFLARNDVGAYVQDLLVLQRTWEKTRGMHTQIDVTKATATNLAADSVFITDTKVLQTGVSHPISPVVNIHDNAETGATREVKQQCCLDYSP